MLHKYQCFYCKNTFTTSASHKTGNSYYVCSKCNQRSEHQQSKINSDIGSGLKYESKYGGINHIYDMINTNNHIKLSGREFEFFCADILWLDQFINIRVTKTSCDNGVDIRCEKNGKTYVAQCKCITGTCSNKAIQEILSGKDIYDADACIVMCNTKFSKQAATLASAYKVDMYNLGRIKHILECYFASLDAA